MDDLLFQQVFNRILVNQERILNVLLRMDELQFSECGTLRVASAQTIDIIDKLKGDTHD